MSWPVDEKVKRIRAARAAIANARLEGREPSPETFALLDRFIAGEITIEQALEVTKHLRR
jgi:Antitoxin VbhA